MAEVTYRQGSPADSRQACRVLHLSIRDMTRRLGLSNDPAEEDEATVVEAWEKLRALYDHLAESCERFVIAELQGEMIGYARSILREGTRELTEFFVLPGRQSAGVGRTLLDAVFPTTGAQRRAIIATYDIRAQARYLKTGVYPRFPIVNFSRAPRSNLSGASQLEFAEIRGTQEDLDALGKIDRAVLGYTRDIDHRYWQKNRRGFFVAYQGELAGYGYTGYDGGPMALLDENNYPEVLAYAESQAAEMADRFHIEVPMVNRAAVDWLL